LSEALIEISTVGGSKFEESLSIHAMILFGNMGPSSLCVLILVLSGRKAPPKICPCRAPPFFALSQSDFKNNKGIGRNPQYRFKSGGYLLLISGFN
jgi:hypothetical protein